MAVQTLQILTDNSPSTELGEVYNVFEEASPFLVYIYDFWMGCANCPLFAEQVLLTAESLSRSLPTFLHDSLAQQWGIPPEHRSAFLDASNFKHFPTIPIPFCLQFREGSAMMRLVPLKELDPFASLHEKGISSEGSKLTYPPNTSEIISSPPLPKHQWCPLGYLEEIRRSRASRLTPPRSMISSPHSTHSRDLDNELLSRSPSIDTALRASSSSKASVLKMGPKSKATVKVVENSKVSDPPSPAMVYKRVQLPPHSRKIAPTTSKGKSRQVIVTDDNSASNEVESEDEDEDEDAVPPTKRLKTISSISASLPRRSVKLVSVPKQVTKAAAKPVPASSVSAFKPVLLANAQGHLQLPNQSTGTFMPFLKFAHARNSAALTRENLLFAVNLEFLELGSILETQNAQFTMKDLMQINWAIHNPSIPSQACVSALARGESGNNLALLPSYKCQACSSRSLKCMGSLDMEMAIDALNVLYTASTSSTHKIKSIEVENQEQPSRSSDNADDAESKPKNVKVLRSSKGDFKAASLKI
ncbi:hypothetical protein EV359DRAFT_86857 [Lentinula novae-zelandiae]|nr:hypothetical protein EV359DRAFT_86857 [Lentinula novae-zelandiae]